MLTGSRKGIRAGALGIADQILLSGTNLAIGLALAREMAPASFGIFVVTFALYQIAASVQIALVTDPLVVLGSPREGLAQTTYFASAWRLQCRLSAGLALLAGATAPVVRSFLGAGSELPAAMAGLAIAIVPLQLQMFLRSLFFSRLQPGRVLANDLVLATLRLGLLAWLVMAGELSTFWVFTTSALAALVSTGLGLLWIPALLTHGRGPVLPVWREHWAFGRWLLATSGAYWGSGQAPTLLASAMMTPVAAAIIKACQYLVAPLNVAFMGLDGILTPRAARIRSTRGPEAGRRFLTIVAAGCAAAVAIYAAVLLPAAEPLMGWLYKGQYAGHVALVGVLLLDALLSAVGRGPMLGLKIAGRTRSIFLAYLAGAIAGVAALVLMTPRLGVLGVAIAAPVSSGVTLAALLLQGWTGARGLITPDTALVIEP